MDKIAVVVDQTGYGYYPTDWIILKPRYRFLQDTFNGIPSVQNLRICQSGYRLL